MPLEKDTWVDVLVYKAVGYPKFTFTPNHDPGFQSQLAAGIAAQKKVARWWVKKFTPVPLELLQDGSFFNPHTSVATTYTSDSLLPINEKALALLTKMAGEASKPTPVVTHEAMVLAAKKTLQTALVTYLEASLQSPDLSTPDSVESAEGLATEMIVVTCLVEDLGYDLDMALYLVETAGVAQVSKFFAQLPLLEVPSKQALEEWREQQMAKIKGLSVTSLPKAAMSVSEVEAQFSDTPKVVSLGVTETMKQSDPAFHELGQQLKAAISKFEKEGSMNGFKMKPYMNYIIGPVKHGWTL